MLFAARLARLYGDPPSIVIRCHFTGLQNRRLATADWFRIRVPDNLRCVDDEVTLETQATSAEIEDNLAEVLHPFLLPLYEQFAFYELPMELVRRELEGLRRGRF